MLPGFTDRGPTATAEDVAAFERRCGIALPADYRHFLLAQNGGNLSHADDSHRYFSLGIAHSLGLTVAEVIALGIDALMTWPDLCDDLELRLHWCRDAGNPLHWLPIAEVDPIGSLFLLALAEPDSGAVLYACVPEGAVEWQTDRVAGSFGELFDG